MNITTVSPLSIILHSHGVLFHCFFFFWVPVTGSGIRPMQLVYCPCAKSKNVTPCRKRGKRMCTISDISNTSNRLTLPHKHLEVKSVRTHKPSTFLFLPLPVFTVAYFPLFGPLCNPFFSLGGSCPIFTLYQNPSTHFLGFFFKKK